MADVTVLLDAVRREDPRSAAEDRTVRLWDRSAGAAGARTGGPGPFGGGPEVTFTPDGRYLATANANGTVCVLRVEPSSPRE